MGNGDVQALQCNEGLRKKMEKRKKERTKPEPCLF